MIANSEKPVLVSDKLQVLHCGWRSIVPIAAALEEVLLTGSAVVCWGRGVAVLYGGVSVVVSTAHHLLAGGPEQDGVFKLSRVAALAVAQWGVGVHDAQVAQVLQSHQVLALAQAVQPAAAKCQRAKILINDVQQVLCSGQPGKEI